MSARPSNKKALAKYLGSASFRKGMQFAAMNKVDRKAWTKSYKAQRASDLRDDMPYPALTQMIPRGFVGARGDAKFLDTAFASYANNTTGSLTHISPIPQGVGVNQREGKACRVTSVNVRGVVAADTTTTTNVFSNYLVWDYQPNKVLPAITVVFDTITAVTFPSRENNERFKIIKKWYGVLIGNVTTPATGKEAYAIDDYVRLPEDCNILCTTADTTGVITNTIQGALYFITMGTTAAGTADGNTSVGFRLNFTDKNT